MDDLYVISQGKYRFMRCAAIILPIVAVLLTTAFVSVISGLIADCVPDDGVWYCEELDIEAEFIDQEITFIASGEELVGSSYGDGGKIIEAYRILGTTSVLLENGEKEEYENQETVYRFFAVKLKKNRWYVCDKNENEYIFTRK